MEKLTLEFASKGSCGNSDLRKQLSEFVLENFGLLYFGATRLGKQIPEDYYAPRRVQINDTRLHEAPGLKIAGGHHQNAERPPSEAELRAAVSDIQQLLDAAAENHAAAFVLVIEEKET